MRFLMTLLVIANVLLIPGVAGALSCAYPVDTLDRTDVVLRGRVALRPLPGVAIFAVDRYYKGAGPRYLAVDFGGGHWARSPETGAEYLAGFHEGLFGLTHNPCNLLSRPDDKISGEVLTRVGEGRAPGFGFGLRSARLGGALLLLVAGGGVWSYRRRRAAR